MRKNNKRRPALKKSGVAARGNTGESRAPVIVVGIGAPAASQKSLQKLFSKMAAGQGVAFVVIRHMHSAHRGLLVKMLKKQTALSVVEAKNGMPVLADRIHVIPPDKFLNITGGKLTLQQPVLCNGLRMPIDHFLCSLAIDQRRRGIGVLLSGKGSDGTLGLSEIKAAGGRTIVEDPANVKHPDMSKSAIDAGVAEIVLPAEGIAEALMNLAEQIKTETREPAFPAGIDPKVRTVLDIIRAKIGHDFRCYKPSTIVRRMNRRMGLAKITSLDEYAKFLHEHPGEVGLLQKDLLIGVTDFFRQPHAWETLTEKVISPIVENAEPGSEIRAWVPGCSTGKEAYSLAMLLTEEVEKSGKKLSVQIFATDSDVTALATARSGIYPKEDMGENISPARLRRFFLRKDGHYQVVKDIREWIVFAPQNITAHPPFSRLDLISCRNLLIYLDQQVQKKIIDLFHFSLREGGFLFLGTAENVGDREDIFEPVAKKWRIYRRIGVGHRVGIEIPVRVSTEPDQTAIKPPIATQPSRMSLTSGAQHMLLDRFVPACVMIDRKLHVLYVHGRVEDYMTFPTGELTTRIVDMAREGLRARLRGAIGKCLESNKAVAVTARVRRGDKSVHVKAIVSPLRYPREIDGLLLITFEDYRVPVVKSGRRIAEVSDTQQLMDELKITREELQSTIEQLENSNDELKALNEEVTAANEELQSANEELETSKEELQSLNEELNTINTRLQEKVDELENINNDVVNLLSSTNIATVFLDKNLRIKRFTPAVTNLFSLIASDAGRHIGDVLRRFSDDALLGDARRVLVHLTPISAEVQAEDGRWYIRCITPYRTQDDYIEGVVLTFVDVDDLKRAQAALQTAKDELEERVQERTVELRAASLYARSLIEASLDPLVTISPEGKITDVNDATEHITGRTRGELIGTEFSDYFTDPDAAQAGYRRVLAEGQVHDYPLTIRGASGKETDVLYNATVYRSAQGEVQGVFAAARDVTERNLIEEELARHREHLEDLVEERTAELEEEQRRLGFIVDSIADGFYVLNRDWQLVHVNDDTLRHMGKTRDELIGHSLFDLFPTIRGSVIESEYKHAMETGEPVHFETPSIISGAILEVHAYPGPENLTILFRDITERRRTEEEIRLQNSVQRAMSRIFQEVIVSNTEEELGERCLAIAEALTGSKIGFIGEIGRDGYLHDIAISNPGWEACAMYDKTGHRRPPGDCKVHGIYGRVLTDGKSLIVNEPSKHADSIGLPEGHPPLTAFLGVPFIQNGKTVGMVALGNREGGYTAEQQRTIEVLTPAIFQVLLRKRAEISLREEHARSEWLARFPEENPNPVMRVSKDGKVLYCNPASKVLHEWQCEVGEEPHEPVLSVFKKAVTEGHEVENEAKIGGRFYSVTVIPAPGESYANIYGRDITERKQAEAALQARERLLQDVIDGSTSPIFLKDNDGKFITINATLEKMLRISREEIKGKTDYDIAPKEVADYWRAHDKEVIATGKAIQIEEVADLLDGHHIFLANKFPLVDADGQMYGVGSISHDITERKQAERELQTTMQRLNTLVASIHNSIVLVDNKGRIAFTNQALCDYFGLQDTPADLVGITASEMIDKIKNAYFNPDEQVERIWKIARAGQPVTGEEIAMRDGRTALRDFVPIHVDERSYGLLWYHVDITERKRAEERVSQSQKTFSELVERAPFGIYIVDSKFRIAQMNIGSQNGAFRNVQPVIGRDFSEAMHILWPEHVAAEIIGHFRHTLETGEPYYSPPFINPRADAAIVESYEWELHRMMLPDGQYGIICYYFDSTKLRQAEEAVRESEERYRSLFENLNEAALLIEPIFDDPGQLVDFKYLAVNAAVNRHLGKRVDEMVGKRYSEVFPRAGRNPVFDIYEKVLATGEPFHGEILLPATGRYFDAAAYRPAPGRLALILTDVTERRAAEAALRRLNQELEQRVSERTAELRAASLYSRSLIEASLDPLVTISPEGKITDVNESTEQVTGWSRQKLIGTDFSDYFTDPDAAQAGYRKILGDGQIRDYPLTIRHASGSTTDVLYNATVYRDAQGQVQGVFAAARDVTERKRIDAELVKYRDHLEDLVKERTAEMEAANKELESFSYSVSHDLRAPLRAIDGYARLIMNKEGDKFDAETTRKFNAIRSNAQTMGQLINDILTLSRVVKKQLSASKLDMDAIVKDAWKEIETINPERNIKLAVGSLPVGYGDATLIRQVYSNLLSNAAKFTKYRETALIEVGGYVEGDENVYYIKDNGAGFEMEYYDKLYGIFQRLHKVDEFEGTGVGLATVQRIVQRHGGRAWAEGKPNEGATFYFSLPVKRNHQ
ncbi:MAG TPA: PAS domain-containing protein [Syntrophales bacterium]|nr:PAS domain-containing protein [Syntrophales bacterium]